MLEFLDAQGARFNASEATGSGNLGAALKRAVEWGQEMAGFAPLVALWLCSEFGLAYVGYYLLSGAVVTLAALGFSRTLETVR